MGKIRILLADDHTLMRAGIRALLLQNPNVEVVAEASSGSAAIELAEQNQPDIVLLDVLMQDVSGLEVAREIGKRLPQVRIVMLSGYCEDETIFRALRLGAWGYLLKNAQISELEIAISAVASGDKYLSPGAATRVINHVLECTEDKIDPLERLTPRQRQVLELMVRGKARKEMAQQLKVSRKTIDTYRAQIMEQLDIHELAGLIRYAMKTGLVPDATGEPPVKGNLEPVSTGAVES